MNVEINVVRFGPHIGISRLMLTEKSALTNKQGITLPKQDIEFDVTYKATDGWRGYWNVSMKSPGWERVGSGWQTGYPDETVSHKIIGAQVYERMEKDAEKKVLPFNAVWVFAPTSNVFSMATDCYIRESEMQAFIDWLELGGVTRDRFEGSFS